jgi:hypothetical protein
MQYNELFFPRQAIIQGMMEKNTNTLKDSEKGKKLLA